MSSSGETDMYCETDVAPLWNPYVRFLKTHSMFWCWGQQFCRNITRTVSCYLGVDPTPFTNQAH